MTPNKFKNAKKSHLAQKSYGSTFCDMSHHTILRSECLWVCQCLSVQSHISKTACPNFTKFSIHICYLWPWLVLLWRQCKMLYTSGFVDWMMLCFHVMSQMEVLFWSLQGSELFTVVHQVAPSKCAHAMKSAVTDCFVLVVLIAL